MMETEKRYYDLCRLCATYDTRKLDIFSEQGKKKQLSKKIQSFLPFKVDEHDQMPRGLCSNCLYNLENAYNFRCKCIQATYNLEKCLQKIGEDKKAKDETLSRLHRIRPEVSIFAIPNNVSKSNNNADATNTNAALCASDESIPNPLDFLEVGVGEETTRASSSNAKKNSSAHYKNYARDVQRKWSSSGNAVTLYANDGRSKGGHFVNAQNIDDGGLNRRKNFNPRKIARQKAGEKINYAAARNHQNMNSVNSVNNTPPTPGLIAISIGAPTNYGNSNNNSNNSVSNQMKKLDSNEMSNAITTTTPTLESMLTAEIKIEPDDCPPDDMVILPDISVNSRDEKENMTIAGSSGIRNQYPDAMIGNSIFSDVERKPFACALCQKGFTLKSSLNRHYLTAHQTSLEQVEAMPTMTHSILNPYVVHHNDIFADRYNSIGGSDETVYCEVCNRIFHDRPSLWLHMVHAHREQASVSCGICLKVCCDNITLIEHVNTAHAGDTDVVQRRYSCQVCGRQHDSRQKLLKHATLHTLIDNQGQAIHPEEMILLNNAFAPRECTVCRKKFFSDEKLGHHMQTFHSEANSSSAGGNQHHASSSHGGLYQCELCISSHGSRMDRWWHMYHSHNGDTRVTCEYKGCNKIFSSPAIKDEHLANHHQLQGDYTNTCEVCGKLWESRLVFYKHMMNVHPKCLPSVCGVCLKIFSSVDELRTHVQADHFPLDEKNGSCCDVCGRFYGERSKMLRHRRVHNVTDEAPIGYGISGAGNGYKRKDDLQCSLCPEMEFKTLEEIGEHRRTIHQLFVCDLCPKFYNGNNHLWKHVSKQHRGNPDVTCDICSRTSASRAHLERHKLKYHTDPLEKSATSVGGKSSNTTPIVHKCHLCSKIFRIRSLLQKHLKTCKGVRTPKVKPVNGVFPCGKCNKVFEYENTLHKHTKYAHIVHYCDICGKDVGFDLKKDLMTHIRTEHSDHPELRCDVDGCRKLFRMKADLYKHKLEHPRGYFSYTCEVCGDLYSNKKKLRKHLQTFHREEVKFLCGVCNAIYVTIDELINHVHTSHSYVLRRPFTCQICGKGWSVSSKVIEHIGKFHGRQYKPCKLCWKVFDDEAEYQNHVDNHPPAPEKPPPPVRRTPCEQSKERSYRSSVSKELAELGVMSADGTLKRNLDDDDDDDVNLSDNNNTKRLRKRFRCKLCTHSFRLMSELTEHMDNEHPDVSLTDADDDEKDYNAYQKNTYAYGHSAGGSSKNSGQVVLDNKKRKLWTDHQRIICGSCRRVWNTKKQLWQHIIRSHAYESQFTCGICLKICRNYADLSYHIDARHITYMKDNYNRFACRVCGHYHNSQCKLEKHRSMHKNTLPFVHYVCNYCDKTFKSKIFFYEHINKHKSRKHDFKFRFKKLYLANENDVNDPETRFVLLKDNEPDMSDEDMAENIAYEYEELMDRKASEISHADRNEGGGDVDMMDNDDDEALIEEEEEEEEEEDPQVNGEDDQEDGDYENEDDNVVYNEQIEFIDDEDDNVEVDEEDEIEEDDEDADDEEEEVDDADVEEEEEEELDVDIDDDDADSGTNEVNGADDDDNDDEDDEQADEDTNDDDDDDDDDTDDDDDDDDDDQQYELPTNSSRHSTSLKSDSTIDPLLEANATTYGRPHEIFIANENVIDEDDDTDMNEVHGFDDEDCDVKYKTNDQADDSIFTSTRYGESSPKSYGTPFLAMEDVQVNQSNIADAAVVESKITYEFENMPIKSENESSSSELSSGDMISTVASSATFPKVEQIEPATTDTNFITTATAITNSRSEDCNQVINTNSRVFNSSTSSFNN